MANTFINGKVYVRRHRCATCIFHSGNLMHLAEGRREQMVTDADRDGGCIPCHSHTYRSEPVKPMCRGYFDVATSGPVQIAARLGFIEWYENDR